MWFSIGRQARVKVDANEAGVYHLCSRVAKGWYPLAEAKNQKKLLDLIQAIKVTVTLHFSFFTLHLFEFPQNFSATSTIAS